VFEEFVKFMLDKYKVDHKEVRERTPGRFKSTWEALLSGYEVDPLKVLGRRFKCSSQGLIIVDKIEFFSVCAHHFLPFFGYCHVAYLPDQYIVGLSKIGRLVDCFSRRLQVQESLTFDIARTLDQFLRPLGVAVVTEAKHLCLMSRGLQKQNATLVSSEMLGEFRDNFNLRNEFLLLLKRNGE